MKVTILGTGDLTKIPCHTKFSQKQLQNLIQELGKIIAQKGHHLVIVPDRGIPTEVAKVYKENQGKKVYGLVPTKDKKYGSRHIQPYLKLIDQKIPYDHWYDVDGEIAAAGDICIIIGLSPGIMREFSVLKYHRRYLKNQTKVYWFKNTVSQPLAREITEEIPVNYITSIKGLEKVL